jgi:hypothetical protein
MAPGKVCRDWLTASRSAASRARGPQAALFFEVSLPLVFLITTASARALEPLFWRPISGYGNEQLAVHIGGYLCCVLGKGQLHSVKRSHGRRQSLVSASVDCL